MGRASGLVGAAQDLRAVVRDAASWPAAERRAVLAELEQVGALVVGARSDVLAAEQVAQTWQGPGVPTLGARLGRDTKVGRGVGNAHVRQGETWGEVPVLARAAEAGEITTGHVDAVGRATRGADPAVREVVTSPQGQRRLLGLARRLDAPRFAQEVTRMVAGLDPTGPDRDLERQRSRRFFQLLDTPEGTRVTGLLDRRAGRRLRLAIEAVSPRPAADDPRTAGQRTADAVIDLAETVLSLPDTGSGAAVRPHVSLIMSAETFAHLREAQARRADAVAAEDGCLTRPLVFPGYVAPVTDDDGDVVPLTETARVLCDCAITRVVLDAAGEPLDLGRAARLYTGAQRRFILARDRGCAWQGCGAPARWCEVHHIVWWDRDDGATSVENGVALCRHHHQEVHRLDLHLDRRPVDLPSAGGCDRLGAPPGGLDPGRPLVRYVIRTRDGVVIAGENPGAGSGGGARPGATPDEGALPLGA